MPVCIHLFASVLFSFIFPEPRLIFCRARIRGSEPLGGFRGVKLRGLVGPHKKAQLFPFHFPVKATQNEVPPQQKTPVGFKWQFRFLTFRVPQAIHRPFFWGSGRLTRWLIPAFIAPFCSSIVLLQPLPLRFWWLSGSLERRIP